MSGSNGGAPRAGSRDLVTVAIPVRNEEEFIGTCLRSVLEQTHTDLQVLVVDGESTDATREVVTRLAEEDPRVELLVNPGRIVPSSLNLALDAAKGLWWVRVDGHSTIPEDYVERAVAHLATGRWGGVAGRKDAVADTDTGLAVAAALGSPFGVGNSTYHHGTEEQVVDHIPFGTYPVSVLRELGGWDEDMVTNQDYEFDYRVRLSGRQLLFDPRMHIDWRCPSTIRGFWRQYRRYGRGKVNTLVRHPESGAVRHYVAPALVAGLAAGLLLSPFRRLRRLAAVPFAAYALVLGTATAMTWQKASPSARPRLPAAFAAMHLGWGVGFWQEVANLWRTRGAAGAMRIFPLLRRAAGPGAPPPS